MTEDTDVARLHAKLELGPEYAYRDFHAINSIEAALQRWPLLAKLLAAKQDRDARASAGQA